MAHLILYDGVCGLCNKFNQFVLKHDTRDRFRFAALQSPLGREVLLRHGRSPDALDSFCLVLDHGAPSEELLARGRGALRVLRLLGPPWSWSAALAPLPTGWLDRGYDAVASRRYALFGRLDACPIPTPEHRQKFLDAVPPRLVRERGPALSWLVEWAH